MPELNPRRVASTKGRFAQVSAAVLAGMAAMFVLQNVVEFRRDAARPPAPIRTETEPSEPEPKLDLPVPGGIKRQAGPVPSSMMLKPEEGLSETGATVVGVSGEEAPAKFDFKAPTPEAVKAKKKAMPRLKTRTMESRFASSAARQEGRFTEFHKPAPLAEEYKPFVAAAEAEKERPAGSTSMTLIEKASTTAMSENLQPALAAQLAAPEVVFWTKGRMINIGLAVLIMILGVIYLVYASGVRDAPPERAEGEL